MSDTQTEYWDQWQGDAGDSNFVKFEEVGDAVEGHVETMGIGRDFNGNPCPELTLIDADGERLVLTAGQKQMRRILAEERPRVGWFIRMEYIEEIPPKIRGRNPTKIFELIRFPDKERQTEAPQEAATAADL